MLDVTNPPSKPVLAIHAGTVRRQAKLEVNQPFVIPHPGTQTGTVEVSLFQQLASHVLPSDNTPEVFCDIPVKKLDGQQSKVQLRVRRGNATNANATPDKIKADDSMVLTRDYLDHHQLQQRIQSLIQDVLREQPENPYKYMLGQLRKAKGGAGATKPEAATPAQPKAAAPKEAAKPLVPKPPAGDKPEGSRNIRAQVAAPKTDAEDRFGSKDSAAIQAMAAARFSVMNLLRSPMCSEAMTQSLRTSARKDAASSISGLAITSVKEKLFAEVAPEQCRKDNCALARASLCGMFANAVVLLSPEYHRAVVGWARHLAYRGAARREEDDPARRASLPTPIVFLDQGGSSWGSWLTQGPPGSAGSKS